MKLPVLLLSLAACAPAQTATDSPLLVNEVRLLRQDIAAIGLAVQRTQVLLHRLQIEQTALNTAAQRLDQAKAQLAGIQQRRSGQATEVRDMEAQLATTQDAALRARLSSAIPGLKREIENWAPQEQEAQARQIDAESQYRAELARRDALEAALDKLDQQLAAPRQ